jgi:hypothetical protein
MHTEGKLEYAHRQRGDGMYSTELFDAKGVTVASAAWYPIKTETGTTTNREENARRLVACWNACDGIDTASLEGKGCLAHLVNDISQQVDDARRERDELVNVLRELHTHGFSANRMQCIDMLLAKYPEPQS